MTTGIKNKSSILSPLGASTVTENKPKRGRPRKNPEASSEAPTQSKKVSEENKSVEPKKRGRPSREELAERAIEAQRKENELKEKLETETIIDPTLVRTLGTNGYVPATFFRPGNQVKVPGIDGAWIYGTVLRHPVSMADMVRVLWDDGGQSWHAAKVLTHLR